VKQHLYLTLQLDVKSTQKEVKPINQASEPPMFSKLSLEELRKFILDSEETIKELTNQIITGKKVIEQRHEFTFLLASNYRCMMHNDFHREKALITLQNENDANEIQQQLVSNMVTKKARLAEPISSAVPINQSSLVSSAVPINQSSLVSSVVPVNQSSLVSSAVPVNQSSLVSSAVPINQSSLASAVSVEAINVEIDTSSASSSSSSRANKRSIGDYLSHQLFGSNPSVPE
jgi:hypothetical protein